MVENPMRSHNRDFIIVFLVNRDTFNLANCQNLRRIVTLVLRAEWMNTLKITSGRDVNRLIFVLSSSQMFPSTVVRLSFYGVNSQ